MIQLVYVYKVLFLPIHFCSLTVVSTVPYSLLPAISAGRGVQTGVILDEVTVAYVRSSCKIFKLKYQIIYAMKLFNEMVVPTISVCHTPSEILST